MARQSQKPRVAAARSAPSLATSAGRVARTLARSSDTRLLAAGAVIGLGAVAVRQFSGRRSADPGGDKTSPLGRAADVASTAVFGASYAQMAQQAGKAVVAKAGTVVAAGATASTVNDAAAAGGIAVSAASQAKTGPKLGARIAEKGRTGGVRAAQSVAKIAERKSVQGLDRLVSSKAVTNMARLAVPLMAARGVYAGVTGYEKDGIKGAALGVADSLTAGRTSAAIDGYKEGGASGALDNATFNVASTVKRAVAGNTPASPAAMQPAPGEAPPAKGYLNETAAARAAAPAMVVGTAATPRAAADVPRADGMTAGYQRTDPRSGKTVTVKEYRTPGAP